MDNSIPVAGHGYIPFDPRRRSGDGGRSSSTALKAEAEEGEVPVSLLPDHGTMTIAVPVPAVNTRPEHEY